MSPRFGIGPVVRQTGRMLRRNGLALALLVLVLTGIGSLADTAIAALPVTEGHRGGLTTALSVLLEAVVSAVIEGVVIALIWPDLSGGQTSFAAALRTGIGKSGPLLVLSIALVAPVALGFVLLIVPGVLLLLRWSVAPCVRVIEGPGVLQAMGRSAVLTRGVRGPILGLYALYLVVTVTVVPLVARLAGLLEDVPGAKGLLTNLSSYALQCVLVVIFTVVYADLRQAEEGGRPDEVAALFE